MNPEYAYKIKNFAFLFIWAVLYVGFVIGGGYLIYEIEHEYDFEIRNKVKNELLFTIQKYNFLPNDTAVTDIISAAIEAYRHGVKHTADLEQNLTSFWDWRTGVFFCNTLVTTVGYGHLYPRTVNGKIFCIFFSIIGILIFGVFIIKLGYILSKFIEGCDGFWKKLIVSKSKRKKKLKSNVKLNVLVLQLIITTFIATVLIWLLPALALAQMNDWSFLTALYYCIITLTTIGLGDIVPWNEKEFDNSTERDIYFQYAWMAYIFIGLVTLSTILNLLSSVICDAAINQAQEILQETKKIIVDNTYKVENMLLQTKEKIKDSTDTVEQMLRQTKENIKDNSLIVEDMLLQTKEKVKNRNIAVADLLKQTKAKIKDSNTILEEMLQETKDKMKGSNILVEDMLVNTKNKINFHSMRGRLKERESTSTMDGFTMRQSDRIKAASKLIRGGGDFVGSKLRGSLQRAKKSHCLKPNDTVSNKKGENPNIFIKIVAEKSKSLKKETIYDT